MVGIKERYRASIELAKKLGWVVDERHKVLLRNGPSFWKDGTHLWKIRGKGLTEVWQCADLIDGHFCNHRSYTKLDLALRVEYNKTAEVENGESHHSGRGGEHHPSD